MLGHWKKMNVGLSGHFLLTSFSIKLWTKLGKSNARTEFLAETHFYTDGCGLFLILSCLHVSFSQGSAKELGWPITLLLFTSSVHTLICWTVSC